MTMWGILFTLALGIGPCQPDQPANCYVEDAHGFSAVIENASQVIDFNITDGAVAVKVYPKGR